MVLLGSGTITTYFFRFKKNNFVNSLCSESKHLFKQFFLNGTMINASGTLKKKKILNFGIWRWSFEIFIAYQKTCYDNPKNLSSMSYICLACWMIITIALLHKPNRKLCKSLLAFGIGHQTQSFSKLSPCLLPSTSYPTLNWFVPMYKGSHKETFFESH